MTGWCLGLPHGCLMPAGLMRLKRQLMFVIHWPDASRHDPEKIVAVFLSLTEVFGDDLDRNAAFRARRVVAVSSLRSSGAASALSAWRQLSV